MIRLDSASMKLQAVLAGAVTTSQPQCTVSFFWENNQGVDTRGATTKTNTNNTTDVDICLAPPQSYVACIDTVTIYNRDTASATVTVKIDDGGTETILVRCTLATGETLGYDDREGWWAQTADGARKTSPADLYILKSVLTTTGDIIYASAANTPARLGAGTSGHVLTSGGAGVAPSWAALPASGSITIGTEQASTSGSAITFTGIPSGVKRVTVMLVGVSTNGTSNMMIQIGTSSGIESTGYGGAVQVSTVPVNFTTGFGLLSVTSASGAYHGQAIISLEDVSNNTWVYSSNIGDSAAAGTQYGGGSKSLSAVLDRVSVTAVNGTDAFDAGAINISYES